MTFPVFVSGEVLGASDMNAVGWWRITGGTHSGALLSLNNVFTADYSNYMLKLDNFLTPSGTRTIGFQLQNASPVMSAYYWAGYYSTFSGGFGAANSGGGGMTYWVPGTASNANPMASTIEIFNPQKALKTNIVVSGINFDAGYHMGGFQDTSTAYNGFRIFNTVGDTCNFNWSLYGYK
jgi:hypothetical protein